jgi:UDP-N-acetyl-D-glucosamine dehydrogenase
MPLETSLTIDCAVALERRLKTADAAVTVMGAGYVGLPLALALAESGYHVWALDVDEAKVSTLDSGGSYIRDLPSEAVASALAQGRFAATVDPSVLAVSDAIVICVPTPSTPQKEPDLSAVRAAAAAVAAHAHPGLLVILRSTSYPGTTEEVVRPALEATGLRVGSDVFLAFAPERIDPGNTRHTLREVPVVVGGCDPTSTRLATRLLEHVAPRIVQVSSPAVAEMAKLLENTFRNVNIALVNQVAQLCERMGLDVWEVVAAAATKPYGFMSFVPGLVGGHCIPVDPYYLAWKAREYDFHMDFIQLAARVNEEMPYYVVSRLMGLLQTNEGANGNGTRRVLVLGVAFKRDVDDARCSPAVRVIELLGRKRFEVLYHDPFIPRVEVGGRTLHSQPLTAALIASADCVLILSDHSGVAYETVVAAARLVFDVRNATRAVTTGREKIVRL